MTVSLFRYIPLSLIDAAMAAGWAPTLALQDTCHGSYAVLCQWLCDCAEAWPLPTPMAKEERA